MAQDGGDEHDKLTVLHADMPDEMLASLKLIAADAFRSAKAHKDIAQHVKAAFDLKYPPPDNKASSGVYHCIVGTNFACSVTHESNAACYLERNNVKLLLFKSKDFNDLKSSSTRVPAS